MFSRSSIFSFNTLVGLPKPGKAFALTLALCLCVRIGFVIASGWLDTVYAPAANMRYHHLERTLIREPNSQPRVLIMGNSLTRYGILEEDIIAAADVPEADVLNISLGGARMLEYITFLRRNPDLTKNVELVICNLSSTQITQRTDNIKLGRLYRYASLGDRLAADGWNMKARLTLDWIWPYCAQRRDAVTWSQALISGKTDHDDMSHALRTLWEPDHLAQVERETAKALATGLDLTGMMNDPGTSPMYERQFNEFIEYWQQRHVKLVVFAPPIRQAYLDFQQKDPAIQEQTESFNDKLRTLADENDNIMFLDLRVLSITSIDEATDFADLTHLKIEGARKLTTRIIAELQREQFPPFERSPTIVAQQE